MSTVAPLLNGSDLTTIQGHTKAAVQTVNTAGDAKVEAFDLPAQTQDKFACQYHPNVAENQLMELVNKRTRKGRGLN